MARNPSNPARRVRVRCKAARVVVPLVHFAAMVERRPRRQNGASRDAGRRFTTAAAVGSAAAFVVFMVVLARKASVRVLSAIPDAQARALFHGHWNMPLRTLYIEAFEIHGRYYTYFGLW